MQRGRAKTSEPCRFPQTAEAAVEALIVLLGRQAAREIKAEPQNRDEILPEALPQLAVARRSDAKLVKEIKD